ncbi:MAG: hypothetical protein Q9N34_00235 [Aquificota bacterium]|nr:hypothetical protein [Aquificota bacterium]
MEMIRREIRKIKDLRASVEVPSLGCRCEGRTPDGHPVRRQGDSLEELGRIAHKLRKFLEEAGVVTPM